MAYGIFRLLTTRLLLKYQLNRFTAKFSDTLCNASEKNVLLNHPHDIAPRNHIPYIGNRPRKKKFVNFVNLEAFTNVFLHFLISVGIFIY